MSAFLVSDQHISMILTWAIDNIDSGTLGNLTPQEWFKLFYNENIRSLKARYRDKCQDLQYWNLSQKRYIPIKNAIASKKYRKEVAIAIIKLVNCWEYQACEGDFDSSSLIWRIAREIKDRAVEVSNYKGDLNYSPIAQAENSKVYDLAPWEYDAKEWKYWLQELKQQEVLAI